MTPAQQRSADSLPKRVITKRNCEEVLLPTMVLRHPGRQAGRHRDWMMMEFT